MRIPRIRIRIKAFSSRRWGNPKTLNTLIVGCTPPILICQSFGAWHCGSFPNGTTRLLNGRIRSEP